MNTTKLLDKYVMTPGDPVKHLMPISQMVSDAFAGGQQVEEISRQYIGGCHYDFDTTRLIWEGDRLVHHWGVWGYPMRIDSVLVRSAGIGAVVTLEEHRKQGLMQTAALDSFKAMYANGYDLTILRGRHYAKFGYVRAWNYVTYRLKPEELIPVQGETAYQPLGPEHMDAICELYNQTYSRVTGSCVRPTYPMLNTGDMGAYGWFDSDGRLAGYVRSVPTTDGKKLQCLEATGDPQPGFDVLADLFKKAEYEEMTFFTMPRQHPMLEIIRRGFCIIEDRYFYHTGWQVRIVNLLTTLQKITPLLEARLQKSHFAGWQGSLLLDAGEQFATLEIDHGKVTITTKKGGGPAIHGGPAIGRLLIGSDEPEEIFQQAKIEVSDLAGELAEVLFPNLYPMMSHADEF